MQFRTVVGIVLFALVGVSVSAQQATIFPFMRGTISARMAGLGGATVAMTNDVATVVMNPASLVTIDSAVMSATFSKNVLDLNSGYAVYGDQWEGVGAYAFTASFNSNGVFERRSRTGELTGDFTVSDVVLAASFAREIDSLISYGATIKFMHSSAESQQSTAIAADIGLMIRIPQSRTNLGFSLLNAGTQLTTYDGVKDKLPLELRLGINHRLRGLPLLVNFSLNHLTDEVNSFTDRFLNFSLGGELYVGKYVQVRLGYDNATRNLSGVNVATQLTGLSGGIGVHLRSVNIDYAMSSLGSAALVHRISVGLGL
ncbi:MAG: PorV/PorQ family protein [Ignavibacteria bacterium]|nr:PorV/PorQ family protein [Ignavibacteria bacterium]